MDVERSPLGDPADTVEATLDRLGELRAGSSHVRLGEGRLGGSDTRERSTETLLIF